MIKLCPIASSASAALDCVGQVVLLLLLRKAGCVKFLLLLLREAGRVIVIVTQGWSCY